MIAYRPESSMRAFSGRPALTCKPRGQADPAVGEALKVNVVGIVETKAAE